MGGGVGSRVVTSRAICLFADKAKLFTEAAALFSGGQIQGVDVHGIWVMRGARICWSEILIGLR